MAGLNAGDIVCVTLIGSCLGQRIQQALYYEVQVGSITNNSLTAELNVANDMTADPTYWPKVMQAHSAQNYAWSFLRVQRVSPTRTAFQQTAGLGAGLIAEDALTANVMGSVEKQTDVAARYGVGRMTTTPLPPSYQSGGFMSVTGLAALDAIGTAIKKTFTSVADATIMDPILWSPKTPGRVLPLAATASQGTVRVMRRRTVGLGI